MGLRFLWRGTALGLKRAPRVASTLESLQQRSANAWWQLWRSLDSATVADAYFIGSIVAAVLVLLPFRHLLAAPWSANSDALSCSFRSVHRAYQIAMPLLTASLALSWYRFFRYRRGRRAIGGRVAVAKWGSLGWVIIIAIVMTLPWRLLWDNTHPRALLDGEPAYVLMAETELVIYSPQTGSTDRIRLGEGRQLERLGTSGYLFEGLELFRNPDPDECK